MILSPNLETEVYNAKVDLILGKSIKLKQAIALLESILDDYRDAIEPDEHELKCDESYQAGHRDGKEEAERDVRHELEKRIEELEDKLYDLEHPDV